MIRFFCRKCGQELDDLDDYCTNCGYTGAFEPEETPEAVNHPAHYQGKHECIDVMRAMFGDDAVKGFCRCNAYKYRFRAAAKNGEEDIRKAEWYEEYLMKMEDEKREM